MINNDKWINSLPNTNVKRDEELFQIDHHKWENTIPKKNTFNSVKKYSFMTIVFVFGLFFVSLFRYTLRCFALPCLALLGFAFRCFVSLCYAWLYFALFCHTWLHFVSLCFVLLCSACFDSLYFAFVALLGANVFGFFFCCHLFLLLCFALPHGHIWQYVYAHICSFMDIYGHIRLGTLPTINRVWQFPSPQQ